MSAQTILQPGDLAVVGVNTNLSDCGEGNFDLISFVCFRDITTGTLIDMTDNGWERLNADAWGNAEGFVSMARTGGTIPAGTVITIRLPPLGSNAYEAISPDAGWSFTDQSFSSVNFNAGGDQIYFLQGGEWDRGNDNPGNAQHDAQYNGGVVLFGFNTSDSWQSLADDPQASGLHPDVEPCFHMEPATGATDFISYSGPVSPAGQLEWISRISDGANWTAYPDCSSYAAPPAGLDLELGTISLGCTICSGCDTLLESIRFDLPDSGGPFTVIFSDGTNEFTATGVVNGDTQEVMVTKTATFEVVSAVNGEGCPVYSNFGVGVTVQVDATPPAVAARAETCAEENGEGVFDLTAIENVVNLGNGEPVSWYLDASLTQPVVNPAAHRSAAGSVFAVVGSAGCSSDPVPVDLTLIDPPLVEAEIAEEVRCGGAANGQIRLSVSGGSPPYLIDWSDDAFDNQAAPDNVPAGTYGITVTDTRGCADSTSITLFDPEPLMLQCAEQKPVSAVGGTDGIASIEIAGGVAPYDLQWTGPASGNRNVDNPGTILLENLTAGNYQLVISDRNGCQMSCFFTITDPVCTMTLTIEKEDVTCAGLNDGTVSLTINGGTAPYDIKWDADRFDGMQELSGLPPGTYSVIVEDAAGCTSAGNATIVAANGLLDIDISPGGPVCFGDCYGFSFSLEGDAPFMIEYQVTARGSTVTNVLTTDNTTDFLEICPEDLGVESGTIEVTFLSFEDANCRKELDRVETIILLSPPVTVLDTTLCASDSLVINEVTYNAANPSGTEVLTGGAVNGCDSTVVISLSFGAPTEFRIDSTLCEGGAITVNGVLYDEGNPSGVEVLKGAATSGCDSVIIINLTFEGAITTTLERTLCEGEEVVVGNTVYDQFNPSGTEVLQRLSGCDSIVQVNLQFVPGVAASLEGGGSICSGDSTVLTFRISGAPSATIQLSDGVNAPVMLENISDGHTLPVAPAVTTTYSIDFALVNGTSCPAGIDGSVTVEVSNLSASIQNPNDYDGYGVSCAGRSDGALALESFGGIAPLRIEWSTGAETALIENLGAGDFSVTVTDGAGCQAGDQIVLTEPDPILVQSRLIDPTCPGDLDGALVIEAVDGGAAPYSFRINSGETGSLDQIPFFVREIGAGSYDLEVIDANGCSAVETFTADPQTALQLEIGENQLIGRGDSVILSPVVSFSVDSLQWSPSTGLSDPLALTTIARPQVTTTYQLTVFDPKGCRISDQVTIVVEERSRLFAPNAFSPNDDGVNDYFNLFARSDEVQTLTLRIFDRWGSLVFEQEGVRPNVPQEGWDGRSRGRAALPGVYLYFAEINYRDGTEEMASGEVVLLR